jgi:hypothetical protein
MLWTVVAILAILWLLGIITSYTAGGLHSHSACGGRHRCAGSRNSGRRIA